MSSEPEPKTSMNSDPLIIKAVLSWIDRPDFREKNKHRQFYKRAIWKIIRTPAFIVFTPCVSAIPIPFWTGQNVTPSFTNQFWPMPKDSNNPTVKESNFWNSSATIMAAMCYDHMFNLHK